ncbi:pentapeptide repeat-containing protein [Rhodopirellula sp. JC639]
MSTPCFVLVLVLSDAVLSDAVLSDAVLSDAVLSDAVLVFGFGFAIE